MAGRQGRLARMAGITLIGVAVTAGGTGCDTSSLPSASCGSAATPQVDSATVLVSAGRGALRCFKTAARQCKAASLAVNTMTVDTGWTGYVFVISPGGKACTVTEWFQTHSGPPNPAPGPIGSAPCRIASVTGIGVMLSCAGARTLIPATTG